MEPIQDQIARTRAEEIKTGKVKGKTEADYYDYLRKRGITERTGCRTF